MSVSALENFSETVEGGRQQLDETTAICESAMSQADEIASIYLSVGAETATAQSEAMKEKIEAAITQMAAAKSDLEEASNIAHALSSGDGLLTTGGSSQLGGNEAKAHIANLWTQPSHSASPDHTPAGLPASLTGNREKQRGINRENETAATLARAGFDVRQNPPPNAHGKEPDYVIEGEYWDCYSPAPTTKIKGIHGAIEKKVRQHQANRIAVNCDDNDINIKELQQRLQRLPIRGLEEVKIIKDDKIVDVFPVKEK